MCYNVNVFVQFSCLWLKEEGLVFVFTFSSFFCDDNGYAVADGDISLSC